MKKGSKQSSETKEKISKSLEGHKVSDETRVKIGESNKGKKTSEDTKRKISKSKKGQMPWNTGIKLTEKQKEKAKKNYFPKGQIPWNKDMVMSKEYCKKLSNAHLGQERTEETKKKISIGMKGKQNALGSKGWCAGLTKETDERIRLKSEKRKGYKHTKEAKKIIGIKGLGRIPWNKGKKNVYTEEQLQRLRMGHAGNHYEGHRWNKDSIEIWKWFDKYIFESEGQYATNGGEHIVEGWRYAVDYINHQAKVIIEWDEEAHYFNDKLREEDKIRQKRIEKAMPDYDFIRIRESQLNYFMLCLLVAMRYKNKLKG